MTEILQPLQSITGTDQRHVVQPGQPLQKMKGAADEGRLVRVPLSVCVSVCTLKVEGEEENEEQLMQKISTE